MVHLFAAVGRFDEIAKAIEDRFGHVTDVVSLPESTPLDLIQDIARISRASIG